MRLSLSTLLRTLAWAAIAITAIAVGLGRSRPKEIRSLQEAAPRYHAINGRLFPGIESRERLLDRETGELLQVKFPEGDLLDHTVCSPWRDERGQYHMVSRWTSRSGDGGEYLPREFGLALYTFPEGRIVERVALDLMPSTTPCWVPGPVPRILFVSGGGVIYRFSFEPGDFGPGGGAEAHRPPEPLKWRVTPPGAGMVFIKDLIWPTEPKLGGRLIASLGYQVPDGAKLKFVSPQLWWLRLSDDGLAIEDAGRLTVPDSDADGRVEAEEGGESLPNIASTPEGGVALAYLRRSRGDWRMELRVAPISIDGATGSPVVERGKCRSLSQRCAATVPIFSADGRWVYGLVDSEVGITRVATRRFSVSNALSSTLPGPRRQRRPDEDLIRLVRADRPPGINAR